MRLVVAVVVAAVEETPVVDVLVVRSMACRYRKLREWGLDHPRVWCSIGFIQVC